ncbi:hypothetical protein PFICI_10933 [Pestalotiopsis fici W106-1]|uniref:Mitochondrial import inner membrane translocase subunit TIM50 n=1 Tax=Pestalotiopsis fici (strain W106-1 / CGMCC3.15140) TaxID=1229662 RepID=W3WTB6_PESFW|nr:uncharacterized protein PFICI_10933 [Pestalotiopsis fici W106-1]ETS77059.1 hypothetical protein PFICI_10933 [Pestalotiopsis fici W106-1]
MPPATASSRPILVVAQAVSGISRRRLQFFHPLQRQTPPLQQHAYISARHICTSPATAPTASLPAVADCNSPRITTREPLSSGDEKHSTTVNIMSPRDFYGGRANAQQPPPPPFNPFAGVFAPTMMMPMQAPTFTPWSSQPPYSGQDYNHHQNHHWQGHQGQGQAQADEVVALDAAEDSDSSPSVGGEPTPQSTPHQTQTTGIPILDGSSSAKKPHKKKQKKLQQRQQQQQQQQQQQAEATTATTRPAKKRPYAKPTAGSGGVPNPSTAYIAQSARPPSTLAVPRRILVIIDLNGTLLHRPNSKKSSTFVERPFTRTFLQYCLQTFVVAIWSSAKPENVGKMVPQILSPADQERLVAVWGRDTLGLSADDYNQRVQCYKRLERFWGDESVATSHPEAHLGRRWDQTNTVLIDDSKEKARSQPYNIIQLPEFEGDIEEGGYVLPQVHNYLNELAFQRDISSFIREKPFKFDPSFTLAAA